MILQLKKTAVATAMAVATLVPATASAEGESIIMVSGPLVDPFFSALKAGFDDASAQLGVDGQYSTITAFDNVVGDLARLLETAVNAKPDALLVGNFFPDALNPIIQSATEQGIPVIIHNSGLDSYADLGAIAFIGEEPEAMGRAGAAEFIAAGVTNALCFNHAPSNPVLTARCKGFADAMAEANGSSTEISIPEVDTQNPQVNVQALKGAILTNPDLKGIFTLGSSQAAFAVQAVEEQGKTGDVHVGTVDLSSPMLQSVIDGDLLFLLDQQPYMQSYLSVIAAANYVRYGLSPVGVIKTGPMVVNGDNAAKILEVNEATGYRGAK